MFTTNETRECADATKPREKCQRCGKPRDETLIRKPVVGGGDCACRFPEVASTKLLHKLGPAGEDLRHADTVCVSSLGASADSEHAAVVSLYWGEGDKHTRAFGFLTAADLAHLHALEPAEEEKRAPEKVVLDLNPMSTNDRLGDKDHEIEQLHLSLGRKEAENSALRLQVARLEARGGKR